MRRRLVCGALSLAWASAVVAAAQSPSPPPSQAASSPPAPEVAAATTAIAESRRLIAAGRAAEAIPRLQALAGAGGDALVREALGVAYYHAGDAVRAVEQLEAVVDQLPMGSLEKREATQVLGLSLYLSGRIAAALPLLEQTRAFAPDSDELSYVLGMAYIQTGQAAKAREVWARAFRVPADSGAARLLTAQMMVRAELDDLAEAELKETIARDPRLPQARFLLGQTALFRGRVDEAVKLLLEELEVNPGNAMAYYRLGDAYQRQLKWDDARRALQRSTWLDPYFSGPYVLMGKGYLRQRELGTAEGMLRRALQYDPNNKAAHYLLGQALQQAGRADEARREFDAAERLQSPIEK